MFILEIEIDRIRDKKIGDIKKMTINGDHERRRTMNILKIKVRMIRDKKRSDIKIIVNNTEH